jgi:F-type H+-transporting ATPase subunit a
MSVEAVGKVAESGGLGPELVHSMEIAQGYPIHIPAFNLFSHHVNPMTFWVNESALTMLAVSIFIIIGAFLLTRKFETFPSKVQNVTEIIVESINSLSKNMIGHHWRPYSAYFGTVILFLAVSNMIGLLGIPWLKPPTRDINLPAGLAVMTLVLIIGSQLKYKKFSGMVKSWFEPLPLMLPFKLMEYVIKPMSLCLRLFGNILGAFIIMELITIVSHKFLLPPVFSLYFDIFDGLLQAFIFTFLSMMYIGEAIE